ncbi:helix-turn-helix domain-containing protein [Streptomyces sp. NPDC101175]|uniref:helix-turn-helix domain-containing protein n=1 Tax=Streptomyces sp. NPDC101175 TaxID=3366123 RepID=UPI003839BCB5
MGANDKESLQRLGELMAQRRMELNMSKRATSEAAGISINTYQRIEEGRPVRDVTYAKIENILGWVAGSVHEILDGATEAVCVERSAVRGVIRAKVPEADLEGAVTSAFVAVSDTLTGAEIRDLSRRVLDELKRRGIVEGETED